MWLCFVFSRPCPGRRQEGECYAQRDCDDRIRTARGAGDLEPKFRCRNRARDRSGSRSRPPASAPPISPCGPAISRTPSRCLLTPCSVSRQRAPSTRSGPVSPAPPSATPSRRCCSASAVTPSTRSRRSGPASRTPFPGSMPPRFPASAEAAAGVLGQLNVTSGETLLLFGGGGSVGIIATQLAVAQGINVISAVGEHDDALARELGANAGAVWAGRGRPGPRAGHGRRRVRRGRKSSPGRRDRPGGRPEAGHHLVRPGGR